MLINSLRKQLHQFDEVTQRSHPPSCDVDVTQYTASLLECDLSTLFGVLLNKSLYCMFPDPFLPRVAVRVGKGSGYARLAGDILRDKWKMAADSFCHQPETILVALQQPSADKSLETMSHISREHLKRRQNKKQTIKNNYK